MRKVIIESAVNGLTQRSQNPHTPHTIEQTVATALDVCDAGASIIHFHVLGPNGEWIHDVDDYAAVYRGVRASNRIGAQAVYWPTFGAGKDIHSRFGHFVELAKDPATRPDIGACDMGTVNILRWDVKKKDFTRTSTYENPVDGCRETLALMRDNGLPRPTLQVMDATHLRTVLKFLELGILQEPLLIKFYLGGPEQPIGLPPTSRSLEAYLDMLSGVRTVWFAAVLGGDVMPLIPTVIGLGGHVRVGLEDFHYAEDGQPTNVELVERAATIVRAMNCEVATPQEARAILEI